MSGSSSSSSSSAETKSVQEDNRVVGEGNATVLGKNAIINNEFSDNVANAFTELISLAREAGSAIVDTSMRAVTSNEKALDTVATVQSDVNKESNAYTDMIPIFIIGAVALFGIIAFKKG